MPKNFVKKCVFVQISDITVSSRSLLTKHKRTTGRNPTCQEVSDITRSTNHCSPVPVRLQRQALVTCAVHYKIETSAILAGQLTLREKASCTHAQTHMSKRTWKKKQKNKIATVDPPVKEFVLNCMDFQFQQQGLVYDLKSCGPQ